jgi:hypothetical protein
MLNYKGNENSTYMCVCVVKTQNLNYCNYWYM